MANQPCRFCNHDLTHTFVDLGMSPLSNSYVSPQQLKTAEITFPLHAYVCENCLLVQLEEFQSPEHIFNDYAYFSSYSDSWLKHCEHYVDMIVPELGLTDKSFVMEIASNDGYLLQYFKQKNIPVLGIEPADNVAKNAQEKGIDTLVSFFNTGTAQKLKGKHMTADLIIGNNVLAHVPNLRDFVAGLKMVLKPQGVITMEFPHLLRLMEENQFDTIYHEHFSYFSLLTAQKVFSSLGLEIFKVDEIATHGGSLRIYAKHSEDASREVMDSVNHIIEKEVHAGLNKVEAYFKFSEQVKATKRALVEFLIQVKKDGKTIVGYGAPAKGNTLLNYCGVRNDFIDYTVDRNPAKQGMYLPGTRIPIFSPDQLKETKPDFILILPWNLKDEIMEQLAYVREWGCKFILPIPKLMVI
ncbi:MULTISPECIES: class I SAM-dependent methyltransferase [unclassified Paenibacillus]|uniref:class I SAM-dependent methyltransferase n=1 Tax=unclassified Paenibacillus TaxID=185978 RepID=UPI001AE228B1|nr:MULTISPECIES: class I SAM-dependent methyltransferase [unclassified Paenibacillus]MBP1157796.1 2-polyprenyl-3-methyl-5-hydroxy-6-metoxy-1,4-benzoquinol methylase [Paenibacillus sp. PvP091]MBP1171468.1 2-polyprenyl-3-methyl-5-hydroxy-6-metoxy-1,4-benzoquinol methylase [Paenibacillus sp. PvR098]MBP2442496.1 2-polyprenyl-3-methyl-5-hydroxy-6-metoxy-1,4-benzoquinol methylase [Paenibacillus sp. PvP052]